MRRKSKLRERSFYIRPSYSHKGRFKERQRLHQSNVVRIVAKYSGQIGFSYLIQLLCKLNIKKYWTKKPRGEKGRRKMPKKKQKNKSININWLWALVSGRTNLEWKTTADFLLRRTIDLLFSIWQIDRPPDIRTWAPAKLREPVSRPRLL